MSLSPDLRHERITDFDLLTLRIDSVREEVILPLAHRAEGYNEFQQEALHALRSDFEEDQVIDNPTRSGKSFLIRQIAAQASGKGLKTAIVSHRRHILDEHAEELKLMGIETEGDLEGSKTKKVSIVSVHSVAVGGVGNEELDDDYDMVLVDEAHRALGERTIVNMQELFPNAVRIAFTATPDYAENRSVEDEYGRKSVSRSVVEGINLGINSPVRAFLYKTKGRIDNLDPNWKDFSARELKRLADFVARNKTIANIAQDLVQDGRQGLISTIPGEDLAHAEMLAEMLRGRTINSGGSERNLRAVVVRGEDADKPEKLRQFENGDLDILLFCDVLTEGYTTHVGSFLINGRPTTSIVNLTQQMGRVLEPKGIDAIIVDFKDESAGKKQRTVYEVLELDRSVQGVRLPLEENMGGSSDNDRQAYVRSLFRGDIATALISVDNDLIHEVEYQNTGQSLAEKQKSDYKSRIAQQEARQYKKWANKYERILARGGDAGRGR